MQIQSVLRHPSVQREKLIQQLVQDDEKAPLNRTRFSLCAEFQWSAHILEYPNSRAPGVGEREKYSSCSTDLYGAPSTGGGLSSVDTEEPCVCEAASPFLSSRVGGEWLARITDARIYQNLKITAFSSSFMSTFCSVQMISLLSLQLVVKVIKNSS